MQQITIREAADAFRQGRTVAFDHSRTGRAVLIERGLATRGPKPRATYGFVYEGRRTDPSKLRFEKNTPEEAIHEARTTSRTTGGPRVVYVEERRKIAEVSLDHHLPFVAVGPNVTLDGREVVVLGEEDEVVSVAVKTDEKWHIISGMHDMFGQVIRRGDDTGSNKLDLVGHLPKAPTPETHPLRLTLEGGVGVGKTSLVQALNKAIRDGYTEGLQLSFRPIHQFRLIEDDVEGREVWALVTVAPQDEKP